MIVGRFEAVAVVTMEAADPATKEASQWTNERANASWVLKRKWIEGDGQFSGWLKRHDKSSLRTHTRIELEEKRLKKGGSGQICNSSWGLREQLRISLLFCQRNHFYVSQIVLRELQRLLKRVNIRDFLLLFGFTCHFHSSFHFLLWFSPLFFWEEIRSAPLKIRSLERFSSVSWNWAKISFKAKGKKVLQPASQLLNWTWLDPSWIPMTEKQPPPHTFCLQRERGKKPFSDLGICVCEFSTDGFFLRKWLFGG